MNVTVPLCRCPSVIVLDSEDIVAVPRCCHGWKGVMVPDAPKQETQSILIHRRILVLNLCAASAQTWRFDSDKLTL